MSTASHSAGDPQRLLAETRDLVRRVRLAQRGTSPALLVLSLTVMLAIPFYEYGHAVKGHCEIGAGGRVMACTRYPSLALWYWPVALVMAYALIGWVLARRARSRGVGARVGPYVLGGIVLVAVATLITVWELGHPLSLGDLGVVHLSPGSALAARLYRLVSPLGVIGLGLLVLARVERSRSLAGFSLGYLLAVAASTPTGLHGGRVFLPGLLVPGLVLLAGAGLFAVLEHRTAAGAR